MALHCNTSHTYTMLRHLQKVIIQFSPADTSAREFLQRVSGTKARSSNPTCKVDFSIVDDGSPAFVELTFTDKESRKLMMKDFKVDDVSKIIELKGGEMELKGVMQEVGYDPWKPDHRVSVVDSSSA